MEILLPLFQYPGGFMSNLIKKVTLDNLSNHLKDKELIKTLTPNYTIGCKRILISDEYYSTLNNEKVKITDIPIKRITKNSIIREDNVEWNVDAIIYATGFKATEFLVPLKIVGLKGKDLHKSWGNCASAYLGITVPEFPNFFITYGPNTNTGSISIIFLIECQVKYIVNCIKAVSKNKLRYLNLRGEALEKWNEECQNKLKSTVWVRDCHSWYKTADGTIATMWPYGSLYYWYRTSRVKLSDYHKVGKVY